MSLSGIAISIGVLVDAGIVMTENAFTRLHERFGDAPVRGDTRDVVIAACRTVGRPLFFSVLITVISFLPVFALTGTEGKMFHPLAWTKTFALTSVAVLAITLVPALIPTFVRGRLRGEHENWLVRSVADVYRPVLLFLLDRPRAVGLLFAALIGIGWNLWPKLGREFMPPLDEGTIMDMPVTVPRASITEAADDIIARDALLRGLPEVELVVGKVGRADTPTDPAPIDMVETVVNLRPREEWPRRALPYERFRDAARAALGGSEADAQAVAMDAAARFDAGMRELALRRLREYAPELGRALAERVAADLGVTDPDLARRAADAVAPAFGPRFAAGIEPQDVQAAAERAAAAIGRPSLLVRPESAIDRVLEPLRAIAGRERPGKVDELRASLAERREELLRARVRVIDWELEDRAGDVFAASLREAAAARGAKAAFVAPAGKLPLVRKTKAELTTELDTIAQVPGWGNIWTQPIINRVDMLATGVRTMIGVKVFGDDIQKIQAVSNEIAAVLRDLPGAVDVFPDQVVGENYLEIVVDRERAARYGVSVEDVQRTIEVALGGARVTTTVEGRRRFPVRVRYLRDLREDEEKIGRILVTGSGGGAGGMGGDAETKETSRAGGPLQVPLADVADIRVREGPSMIKSENGLLRAYVQLNVRGRDLVGFVEDARRAVAERVKLPAGMFVEWSGQFEHELRARRTLSVVFPAVVFLILLILYLTYGDLADAGVMMLAVPGALVGGVIFQWLFGFNFSVAVWVGYIVCFGLATETGIVMLVYLREAIDRRGGLEKIGSLAALREAIVEGAVHRLRPKLLTEGTTIVGLVPMLWASGVGAELMRPMAAPVLGGILLADEVIDIFIPVIFYAIRKARWSRIHGAETAGEAGRETGGGAGRGEGRP
jgi:Cu(I)/Ag(I) efflux system membrane protein CusA/SilA